MPTVKKKKTDSASSPVKSKTVKKKTVKKNKPATIKSRPKKITAVVEGAVLPTVDETENLTQESINEMTGSKKAKSIVVDVIEDEDADDETFFSDDSLAKNSWGELGSTAADEEGAWIDPAGDAEIGSEKDDIDIDSVDKQKQFFSSLAAGLNQRVEQVIGDNDKDIEEIDMMDEEAPVRAEPRKSISLYRSLAWKFLLLVGFLAALVFYFSFSKLTIIVTPQVEAMSDNIFLKIISDKTTSTPLSTDAREQINGAVSEIELTVNKSYQATGEEFQGEQISGRVRIVNNYIKAQSLVATTRLLSTDGKLFRIKDAVTVAPGEEVEVDIYADSIEESMAISPTRFTIPGLWVGLQDKIYAVSDEAFVYDQKIQKYVKASDIQLANSEASNLILERAKELKPLNVQDKLLYQVIEPFEMTISAKAGDKVEQFEMSAKAKVVVVSFSEAEIGRLAAAKLNIVVPDDKQLSEFDASSLNYVLENYDNDEGVATIKASFSGTMVLKSNAEVIDREDLINLNAEQIKTYLRDYPEIGSYDLEFYPPFVKRAPHLVDRIEIKIKQ